MIDNPAIQKFGDLTREVDWQLNSLLSYIEKGFKISSRARAKISPSELVVQNVLEAYLLLARRFYEQFKQELKKVYDQNTGEVAVTNRVTEAEISILLQQALDKLTAEWARVYGFMAATEAKKTSETEKIVTQLSPLIKAAVRDVGFSSESFPVIPQFGTTYSLGFFNYTDDFMALNLPITALQSPWEWTIFWHEIAGQKVRLLKKTQVEFLNVIREMFGEMKRRQEQNLLGQEGLRKIDIQANLEFILSLIVPFSQMSALAGKQKSDLLKSLTDSVYADWLSSGSSTSLLTNTRAFFQDLWKSPQDLPILMFSFDDLLDNIMEDLRARKKELIKNNLLNAHREALAINKVRDDRETTDVMNKLVAAWEDALSQEETLATQKQALAEEGWSADWLEELFEDSFSVMNFDVNFLPIFDRLLHRHADGGRDLRHPPHHVRLATAAALKLLDSDENLVNENQELPPNVGVVFDQMSSEESETLKKFYPGALSVNAQKVIWLAAKRFHEMHKRMKMSHDDSEEAIQKAKDAIAHAMKKHVNNTETSESIAKIANDVLTSLAGAISSVINTLQGVTGTSENIAASYFADKIDTLLKSRNIIPPQLPLGYRELLNLSFYDVDFLETTITDVRVNSDLRYSMIKTMRVLSTEVMHGTSQGEVTYMVDGKHSRRTTIPNWNVDFGASHKL